MDRYHILHYMNDDEEAEYIVIVDAADNDAGKVDVDDYVIDGYQLYARGDAMIDRQVASAMPLYTTLRRE